MRPEDFSEVLASSLHLVEAVRCWEAVRVRATSFLAAFRARVCVGSPTSVAMMLMATSSTRVGRGPTPGWLCMDCPYAYTETSKVCRNGMQVWIEDAVDMEFKTDGATLRDRMAQHTQQVHNLSWQKAEEACKSSNIRFTPATQGEIKEWKTWNDDRPRSRSRSPKATSRSAAQSVPASALHLQTMSVQQLQKLINAARMELLRRGTSVR